MNAMRQPAHVFYLVVTVAAVANLFPCLRPPALYVSRTHVNDTPCTTTSDTSMIISLLREFKVMTVTMTPPRKERTSACHNQTSGGRPPDSCRGVLASSAEQTPLLCFSSNACCQYCSRAPSRVLERPRASAERPSRRSADGDGYVHTYAQPRDEARYVFP